MVVSVGVRVETDLCCGILGRRIEKERGIFARIAKNDIGRAYGDAIMLHSTPAEILGTFLFY